MTERLPQHRRLDRTHGQKGYILLTLLLTVSLLTIAAAVAFQSLAFQIKRDREEEMVHRGVQYSRAIRRYSKLTGLFPARLEDLRDRGGQRFIRKLYKDPITGKDFRPIYEADIVNPQGVGRSQPFAPASSGSGNSDATNPASVPGVAQDPANPTPPTVPTPTAPTGQANSFGNSPAGSTTSAITGNPVPLGSLIFGVVSASKKETIREFNHKHHYNEWMFFYHPTYDRGLEIKGPTPLGQSVAPLLGTGQPQPQAPSTP